MKTFFKNLWADEAGQSTTEYILILSVVVMVAMKFKDKFTKVMETATGKLDTNLNSALADP
jgi:Flp pilus assembly pilin Flp